MAGPRRPVVSSPRAVPSATETRTSRRDADAATADTFAWTRIIKFDVKTRKPLAQYAYKTDPVAYPAQPAGAFKINGVS